MPVGEFFDRYGRPRARSESADGTIEYNWISTVGYARPGPEGLDERVCKLHLSADNARQDQPRRRCSTTRRA